MKVLSFPRLPVIAFHCSGWKPIPFRSLMTVWTVLNGFGEDGHPCLFLIQVEILEFLSV